MAVNHLPFPLRLFCLVITTVYSIRINRSYVVIIKHRHSSIDEDDIERMMTQGTHIVDSLIVFVMQLC